MQAKIDSHTRFWSGEGPCLILIPAGEGDFYDTDDYERRFYDPEAMWKAETARAEAAVDWPTDGIPTVRPNLGVVFAPAAAGLPFEIRPGQMPWPGGSLTREQIRAAAQADIARSRVMALAEEFYAIHRERSRPGIAAYHADTQGVFDIAHLLFGHETLYALADPDETEWVDELMAAALDLYLRVSRRLKACLGEDPGAMIHGHGTANGVYFPTAGVRMAEDTATLLSPAMIERVVAPAIERGAAEFGGAFVHYCGKHDALFERLCRLDCVAAIDLGNPAMYDARWLMERCAETDTVLCSRVAVETDGNWRTYLRRVAALVRETGVRCILRPLVAPHTREGCAAMLDLWHALTA